jgi:hypothetical protein
VLSRDLESLAQRKTGGEVIRPEHIHKVRRVGLGAFWVPDGAVDIHDKFPCHIRLQEMFLPEVFRAVCCTDMVCVQQKERRGGFRG